jgi:hypothetical protein
MSSVLYLLFENVSGRGGSIARQVEALKVPIYSFSQKPLKDLIRPPGEREMPVRCQFYAQNYFRVYVSDFAVEFHRDATALPELRAAEELLRSRILGLPGVKLRRWVITTEGWDDDDKPFVQVLSQGSSHETLIAEPFAVPNGGPATPLSSSSIAEGPPSVS